jgi:hypothetical protein
VAEPRFMTPVDELRAAAAKLRATAAAVPFGPPWASDADLSREVVSGDAQSWGAPSVALASTPEAATWIALASPALAEPMAASLEAAADYLAKNYSSQGPHDRAENCTGAECRLVANALALARLVNGTAP